MYLHTHMCIPSAELKTQVLRHEIVSIPLTPYRAIWAKYGLEEDFETSFSWSIPASLLSISLKTSCDNNTQGFQTGKPHLTAPTSLPHRRRLKPMDESMVQGPEPGVATSSLGDFPGLFSALSLSFHICK